MRGQPRWGYATAFIAVAIAWLVLSSPWLSGVVTIPYDAKAHFQAQVQFLANALHNGESPFWTHNVFAGSPQIADPQSLIFSPAIILAYFEAVPSFREVDGLVLAFLGVGALSILMFFKDRGWHPAGASVAALAFAFGASAAWRVQHIKQVQSFALLGVSLWLLARALERRSWGHGIAAGMCAGLMVAEPDQVAMLGCYLLAGYVFHHWASSPRLWESVKLSVKPLAAGTFGGALVAGAPVLLTYLFVESSNRPEIVFSEAGQGSLHPASLLSALVGDLYGALNPKVPYWGPASPAWNEDNLQLAQNMCQIYAGALPIVAILTYGLTRGLLWEREIRFFTIGLIAMVIYALGWYTPIFHVLYDYMPGVSMFRRPADATFEIGGLMAIMGGYVIHRRLTGTMPPAGPWVHWFEAGILATGFAISLAVAAHFGQLNVAAKPILVSLGFTVGAVALLLAIKRYKIRYQPLTVAALTLFMTVDLWVNNGPNESTALPPANYDILLPDCKNPTIKFLKTRLREPLPSARRDRVELVGLGFEWPNAALVHGFDHVLGYNPLRLAEITEAAGAEDTVAEPNQRRFTPLFPSYRSRLADLLGLRYIATGVPIERIDKKLHPGDLGLVTRTKDAYIYENPRALPRAMFVEKWQKADFAQLTKDGQWPDFDPTKTVLLEDEPSAPEADASDSANVSPATKALATAPLKASRTRIRLYKNTVVEMEVDAATDGFALLNDAWHPWWYATVDGAPVDILRANVLFRAIPVKAGRHVVRFEFKPLSGAIAEVGDALLNAVDEEEPKPVVR
jgi:hypothetical protein